jgi:hypothetical protein
VASERLFSQAGLTGTDHRNRLSPTTFEALQVLKSAYRNGFIAAFEEAKEHATRLWNDDTIVVEDPL